MTSPNAESLVENLLSQGGTYGERLEALKKEIRGRDLTKDEFEEAVREINGTGDWSGTFHFAVPTEAVMMRRSNKSLRGLSNEVGECYKNSLENHRKRGLAVAYGLAYSEELNHVYIHAWNLLDGEVIDPTWDAIPTTGHYCGIVLPSPENFDPSRLYKLARSEFWSE